MGIFGNFGNKSQTKSLASNLKKTSRAEAERIRNILGIRELEAMPAQAARAFQLASDSKATAASFVEVIESDEILSAKVIRIANSVYFFRGTPANDIEKAVANIGLDELRCLLSASMLRSLLKGNHPSRKQVWANAVATGICCRTLSKQTANIGEGEAFLCGLVHDVGKLLMIRYGGDLYHKVNQKMSSGELTFIEAEELIFETNHVEVGKWVAETWNFPPQVIQAIIGHHNAWNLEEKSIGRNTTTALLVKAADTIAHALGIGHSSLLNSYKRKQHDQELPQAFKQLGISTENGNKFIKDFESQFESEYGLYEIENS